MLYNKCYRWERDYAAENKVKKEEIIAAALDIVKEEGYDALGARTLAAKLNCSPQPIFSCFAGSAMNDKQVGGICGALLTNLTAWFSGIWFDISLVGGWFLKIAECLPFLHAVKFAEYIAAGHYGEITVHLLWLCGYAVVVAALAVVLFLRQMKQ